MTDQQKQIENIIPVLGVADLQRSIGFYTETLGFQLGWGGDEGGKVGSVARDGHSIMLAEGAQAGAKIWVGLEDDSLFEIYRSRGVKVVREPQNRPWAYEMEIADIDGNVLWLGTDTKKDLPIVD